MSVYLHPVSADGRFAGMTGSLHFAINAFGGKTMGKRVSDVVKIFFNGSTQECSQRVLSNLPHDVQGKGFVPEALRSRTCTCSDVSHVSGTRAISGEM